MIPGFNHNVRYRGRIFHCQTEDSGIQNPHIITHLYVGGNILATKKTSYADIVKADHLEEVVTELMKEQHKEFIKRLVSGAFDTSIAQRGVGASSLNGPAPLNVEEGGQNRASFGMGSGPRPKPAPPAEPSVTDSRVGETKVAALADAKKAALAPAPPASPVPLTKAQTAPAQPMAFAPPVAAPQAPVPLARPPAAALGFVAAPLPTSLASEPPEVIDARALLKAPPKPPPPATGTIFGEDLISEKSLDEVILSYLADETNR